ncbi:hypothetical protein GCM10007320_08630 [Pseudorhodoferax aquiterrae]|uniref:Virion structural protein n=1 Tax=Pseudorhodoferax aquiterrae TaxID=747304 RepID=A0ABQ3FX47_9BURK|nr:hypothetical protein [Pseudorhodoferax aquiterrae]GHC72627.1 hypothetical protein GCM10007320_08630 [Pseudorhodoferax aquiterrae]
MRLLLQGFKGENRALHPKLLPETVGTLSRNQNPARGDLRPWRAPLQVSAVPAGRSTIYRMGRDVASDANYWLSWAGTVHAVRGMVADDTTERTYYTGDGFPKYTDNTIGLASTPYPSAWRRLGVPKPTAQMLVSTATAGSSTTSETRYYTYTYVTSLGEESAPAPVSGAWYGPDDSTLNLANIGVPPSGEFTIDRVRIYRTQSGQTGETEFFFLREIAAGLTTSQDDGRALGEVLPTDGWLPPPEDLHTLTGMWNGMMAGISGNAVRYCVAYKPYAWPIPFETLPADAKPVSLAKFGQSLLVLTTAKPVLVSGTSPDSLDEQPLEIGQSCMAPKATVAFGHGVAWVCPDGLAYFGEGGAKILTLGLLTRDDWQAMNPHTMVAGVYEGAYICFYDDADGIRRGFLIDPAAPQGLYFLDKGYKALYFDELQDALYVLDTDGSVSKWDAGAALMTARFVGKQWFTPRTNLGAGRVVADAYPVQIEVLATQVDPDAVTAMLARGLPGLTAPTATSLRYAVTVSNREPFRLPGGFLSTEWQVSIASVHPVQAVAVANAMAELAQ